MKKAFALLLLLAMCLSMAACEGGFALPFSLPANPDSAEIAPIRLKVGQTAYTDLAEFTLESSQFTYYVSNQSTNSFAPMEEHNSMYAASIGHCYVALTFTIKNRDRGGSISYGGSFSEWNPSWTVTYAGQDYPVKGYNLQDNGGNFYIDLSYSAVVNRKTGEIIRRHNSQNYLLSAGERVTLRTFGVIDVEPESLKDGYDFTVGVLNPKGEYEYFTYTVPPRQ